MRPLSSACCRTCGYRVGLDIEVAALAVFLQWGSLLLFVFLIGVGLVKNPFIGIFFCLVCISAGFVINTFGARLMRDELTTPKMVEEGCLRLAASKQKKQGIHNGTTD